MQVSKVNGKQQNKNKEKDSSLKLKLKENEGQRIPPKYALKITLGTERHRIKS
jgi:hypothetical protein